jgi:hypothetical protein
VNSRRALTGEDVEQESELEYLTEIRKIRDDEPQLFDRIKRLPRKARSTREHREGTSVTTPPALLTYFRRGKLDKFFVAAIVDAPRELDFIAAVKVLRPETREEARHEIGGDFYTLLKANRGAFSDATSEGDADVRVGPSASARSNETYVLKRLTAKEIKRFQGFTDADDDFIARVIDLLREGAFPKALSRTLKECLEEEAVPLKVLNILRREIPREYLSPDGHIAVAGGERREVILSSLVVKHG